MVTSPNSNLKLQPPADDATLVETDNPQVHMSALSRDKYFTETRKHAFDKSSRNLRKYFGTRKPT